MNFLTAVPHFIWVILGIVLLCLCIPTFIALVLTAASIVVAIVGFMIMCWLAFVEIMGPRWAIILGTLSGLTLLMGVLILIFTR